ncbi:hypothetical protein EYF80_012556 [Liparis tanakae]|uniref:Uncharacterized protein n=1 Tax=Liparis tanakae TaxID=230148 RepID=A0A4Z2IGU4_9TELE|nr:hypothetical protein EYF80_012556 [Liparis tanakae]
MNASLTSYPHGDVSLADGLREHGGAAGVADGERPPARRGSRLEVGRRENVSDVRSSSSSFCTRNALLSSSERDEEEEEEEEEEEGGAPGSPLHTSVSLRSGGSSHSALRQPDTQPGGNEGQRDEGGQQEEEEVQEEEVQEEGSQLQHRREADVWSRSSRTILSC